MQPLDDADRPIPFPEGITVDVVAPVSRVVLPTKSTLRPPETQGVFLWWPATWEDWLHPDDQELGQRLVPGYRVFTRRPCENYADRELGYHQLIYGPYQFRALPVIWFPVDCEGYRVGDQVEVLSALGRRQPGIATIREMNWNRRQLRIEYLLASRDLGRQRRFTADEFQPIAGLESHLDDRRKGLRSRI